MAMAASGLINGCLREVPEKVLVQALISGCIAWHALATLLLVAVDLPVRCLEDVGVRTSQLVMPRIIISDSRNGVYQVRKLIKIKAC